MKNLFTIRNIIIAVFVLLFIAGIGYKYYEWNTLQSLSALYNQTWTQEFGLVQNGNKDSQPYTQLSNKVFDKNATGDTLINSYNELSGDLQVIISNQEDYLSAVKQNNTAYSNYNTWFLFGKRGDFVRNIVSNHQQYYQYEISDANINDAANWLNYDILSVLKDYAILSRFNKEIVANPKTFSSQYWSELSPLQKYTNSNFTFEHQDEIQKYYPNAIPALQNYQSYFSTSYSTVQDIVNGDANSASYKIPTLITTGTNLNINFADLYSETKDQQNGNAKSIIQIVSNESNSIKDFKADKLFKYPLLPNIGSWKEDLVLCQMYDFKSGLYHNLSTNYIKAKNPSELLNELSTFPPNTQFVDGRFDKTTMKLENNDKQIIFTCLDKSNNTSYRFVANK